MGNTILNAEVIRDLVDVDGNGDFLREVGGLFLTKGAENVAAVEKCLAEGNRAEASKVAHKLKSSGGNFGAEDFAAVCLAIGHLAPEATVAQVTVLLSQLRAEYEATCAALRAEMAKSR